MSKRCVQPCPLSISHDHNESISLCFTPPLLSFPVLRGNSHLDNPLYYASPTRPLPFLIRASVTTTIGMNYYIARLSVEHNSPDERRNKLGSIPPCLRKTCRDYASVFGQAVVESSPIEQPMFLSARGYGSLGLSAATLVLYSYVPVLTTRYTYPGGWL